MLPKNQRLTSGRDFKRVYQKGSFFSVPFFSVNWLNNKTSTTRVGIVVGKKIAAKATERNTLKRKFREASRKIYSKFPAGIDLVLVIKGSAKGKPLEDIEKALSESTSRIGLKK